MTVEQEIAETPPTSIAATRETEPEVVAAVSSAEGNPDQPLSFRIGGIGLGAGLALGYGVSRWLFRDR